jgi:esterase/lipase
MSAQNQGSSNGNVRSWTATRDLALSAWDLGRARGQHHGSERARVMTMRTERRLLASFEAQRGIPADDRSLLLIRDDAQDAVLMLPGTRSTPAVLASLAGHLHGAGLTVLARNLAGGVLEKDEELHAAWRADLLVARRSYQLLAQVHRRVHVVGYSFGSTLAVLLAAREPVSRLVLLAPALQPLVPLTRRVMLGLKLHHLPWIRRRLGWHADVLEGMEKARGSVSRLRMPIYAAQCDDDESVAPDSLRYLQKKARNQISRFQVFPTGGHAILAAHGAAVLNEEIRRFLTDQQRAS